ncbi:uncharacterized protein LOC142228707 [Haematobia irritans]|uniref:uncharacterized protein LOC142228707 n=1 Tax=Haematobia irritans TaxID=7368 RepID=UPI003F4FAA43
MEEKLSHIPVEFEIMPTDISSLCRTCLEENKKSYQIYDYVDDDRRILEMLDEVVPQIRIKEEQDNDLMWLICETCVDKLVTSYKFQQLSIESSLIFRQFFLNSVERKLEVQPLTVGDECTDMKIELYVLDANEDESCDDKTIDLGNKDAETDSDYKLEIKKEKTCPKSKTQAKNKDISSPKSPQTGQQLRRAYQRLGISTETSNIEESLDIGEDIIREVDDAVKVHLNVEDQDSFVKHISSTTFNSVQIELGKESYLIEALAYESEEKKESPEKVPTNSLDTTKNTFSNLQMHETNNSEEVLEKENYFSNNNRESIEYSVDEDVLFEDSIASWENEGQNIKLDGDDAEFKAISEVTETGNDKKQGYPCKVCGKIFNCPSRLKRHSPVHSLDKPFSCEICKRRFSTSHYLKIHKNLHKFKKNLSVTLPPDGIQCPDCPKRFKNRNALASHRQVHTRNSMPANHICKICERGFVTVKTLTDHIKNKHPDTEKFTCDQCGKSFVLHERLLRHLNAHKDLRCHICEKVFTSEPTLKEHMNIHTGKNPYLCSVCGKAFKYHSSLRKHLERHSDVCKYNCPQCSRSFKCRTDMNKHIKTHLGIKAHICDICGTGFTRTWNLQQHKLLHSGKKRYKCNDCPMTFSSLLQLKRHTHVDQG